MSSEYKKAKVVNTHTCRHNYDLFSYLIAHFTFNKGIELPMFRWTLDQYSVNADTVIHFTPMHKTLR